MVKKREDSSEHSPFYFVLYEAEADKWMNTLYLHIESLYSSNN